MFKELHTSELLLAGMPPEFESSVNPIPIQLAEYAHHITASTPGFENLTTSLHIAILPDWTFEKWGLSNFEFQSF